MRRIGVIGCGVVGGAVLQGFKNCGFKVFAFDKFKKEHDDVPQIFDTEAIFVCVPTPTDLETGEQDISALEDTFALLRAQKYGGIIVVKSTVVPGTTQALAKKFGFLKVCHNPEFLTAARPFEDFMEQSSILVGSNDMNSAVEVGEIYFDAGFRSISFHASPTITELAKYFHNVFLSVKVSLCNEMFDICKKLNVDYDAVRYATISMNGIGHGHTAVPGPDGKFGFGGMCFPKDTSAFLTFAAAHGISMETLSGAVNGNHRRRPELK